MFKENFYTTSQAAVVLDYSDSAVVRQLIIAGKMKAEKFGKRWIISKKEVAKFAKRREK